MKFIHKWEKKRNNRHYFDLLSLNLEEKYCLVQNSFLSEKLRYGYNFVSYLYNYINRTVGVNLLNYWSGAGAGAGNLATVEKPNTCLPTIPCARVPCGTSSASSSDRFGLRVTDFIQWFSWQFHFTGFRVICVNVARACCLKLLCCLFKSQRTLFRAVVELRVSVYDLFPSFTRTPPSHSCHLYCQKVSLCCYKVTAPTGARTSHFYPVHARSQLILSFSF